MLTANVMFVNGMAFLTTLSQKLQLDTVEQLQLCTEMQLSNSLPKIVKLYVCTGLIVHVVIMDQEFNKVKDTVKMV
jgi:hypothetical protein